ncbi:MAG: DEAD/DEAH box helicase [Pirellulales bacterium]
MPTVASSSAIDLFHPCTRMWFEQSFPEPTRAQNLAWPAIAAGQSTLLLAPTGSGKTLAAFLAALDRLMFAPLPVPVVAPRATRKTPKATRNPTRVLYISPLKALGVDIDRNLRAPIAGIRAAAGRECIELHVPQVAIRSGDTPAEERHRIQRDPPEILITTPESLYLLLTSKASEILRAVETVIVDEIHVMVASKRGTHLFASLERLERLRRQHNPDAAPLQRIGLSATQRPLDEIARLLGGAIATADVEIPVRPRPVQIIDASEPKRLDLTVEVPVEDMTRLGEIEIPSGNAAASPRAASIWPSIHPRLVELVREHRSTMIFVNSRRLAERLASAMNELAGEELALAHHGSIAKDQRAEMEDRLKRGQLRAIVATSSLELGIDMGAVDLVIQIEAPPSIASGVQRIGRAGHQVGAPSTGVIFPKYRGDLVACAAATGRMLVGHVEETHYARNPLDVLAQQIAAMVARESVPVDEIYSTLRGAAPYAELPRTAFEGVLDLLAGRYPSDEFAELRPRITWDRLTNIVSPRKSTQRIAVLNGGTIPDRGLYGVFLATGDETPTTRVGELDEEMVFETHPGDVFLLGASSWRVIEITRDRVLVVPAPGEPGRMPFWKGEGPGRPLEFGRAIGQFAREISRLSEDDAHERLRNDHALDRRAANNLLRYLQDQIEATAELPSDTTIVVESFLDEIGDWRVCVLSPLGSRVHAPWAMAVAARLREEAIGEVDFMWSDDGMVFRLPESDRPPLPDLFFPAPDEIEDRVVRELGSSPLFATRFRENAARALLLPKRQPNRRTPLWLQRRKSADLLAVAARYPDFPMLLETYRECLRDVFDLPGLVAVLKNMQQRAVRVHAVETNAPSPFAASLLFNYTGQFLYEGDAPLAERRAHALALDFTQLRELLGSADLRELLDAETIDQVALQLQRLDRPYVRHLDDVHDILMQLSPLSREELKLRAESSSEVDAWIEQLLTARRVIEVKIAGELRLAAAEDAARLRDALGVNSPMGLPYAFLEAVADPLGDLVSRYARTHGPFAVEDLATRYGLGIAPALASLRTLADRGRVLEGEFLPDKRGLEWCDAEVLRTIKRKSLARLRHEVEAVDSTALARFLPAWQGITTPTHTSSRGLDALLDAVEQLQGLPLPASTLDHEILPARVADYNPGDLDELCHAGEVMWRGFEGLGTTDGRIALYLTDQFSLLAPQPTEVDDDLAHSITTALAERGALFFDDLARHLGGFRNDLLAALWQLVWSGIVTNDTLAPLRSLRRQSPGVVRRDTRRSRLSGRRGFRSRRQSRLPGTEGRWSLLPSVDTVSSTEKLTTIAAQLIRRYGILTRGMVAREAAPGGFAALYPVLKAMEESARVRRGYFVAGLGGAQFAAPGADDLLRRSRFQEGRGVRSEERDSGADDLLRRSRLSDSNEEPLVHILAATDPANPYGSVLSWPDTPDESQRPQRAAGARVILEDGHLRGYLTRTGQHLLTFLATEDPDRTHQRQAIAKALADLAHRGMPVFIAKVDSVSPDGHELARDLVAAGFTRTSRGYLHRGEKEVAMLHATRSRTPQSEPHDNGV